MDKLPSTVLQILTQRVLQETSAGWLMINDEGDLIDCGGKLATFGLEHIKKGCKVSEQADFLAGILATPTVTSDILSVELDNGEYADIYLVEDQRQRWLVLLGRTESSKWKGIAQQKANELRLLKQKLRMERNDKDKRSIDFSSLMAIVALEQNDDGSYRLLDPTPGCLNDIYPETETHLDGLHPEEDFPFLAHFIEDCETVWNAQNSGRLKSGPWIEVNKEGKEYALEATAILWQGRKILLIEQLNGDYDEQHAILQQGRETSLAKLKLENEMLQQKLIERTLMEERAVADRANQAKSQFLSSMSHELRTPLNSILGFTQLLLSDDDQPLSDDQKESLGYITSSGKHLLELINQVLELSKIESGIMAFTIDDVDVDEVLDSCLALTRVLANKQLITIHHQSATGTVVRADHTRLKQVMINLISNAIKYNRRGGKIFIDQSLTGDAYWRVTVRDTGIGIPAAKQEKLFTAFARLGQENSEIEGTGVGLVLTKTIVELMNGQIGYSSVEGQGSEFWVEFPLALIV